MNDLVAFLAARLDEDEAAAQPEADWLREYEKRPGDWTRFMFDPVIGPFGGQSPLRNVGRGLYVGRVADPDRVLREVAAIRAIVAEHSPGYPVTYPKPSGQPTCGTCHAGGFDWDPVDWPCVTVLALAAIYSDHPDYQQEWKAVE